MHQEQNNIEYNVNLHKEMANFSVNKVVQVTNKKGKRSTIYITNITRLSWDELQLLVLSNRNRFSRMVTLYQEYSSKKKVLESLIRGKPLSSNEVKEIKNIKVG